MSVSTENRAVDLVRTPKTAELIAMRLRSRIVRGELKAGDTLPTESALMAQFGVSRPTLREAFRILETESLISIRRGSRGGAQVTEPDRGVAARYVGLLLQIAGATVADVYQLRTIIEPAAVQMLAKRCTRRDIDDLHACIAELRELIDSPAAVNHSDTVWSDAAYRFHDLVLERAGNRALSVQCAVLREVVLMHMATVVSRASNRDDLRQSFKKSLRSYTRLVDLLEAGDHEGAVRHWKTHMEVAGRMVLRGIESTAVVDLFA